MARRVEAEGNTVPYLLAPATPQVIQDPEVAFLAGGELQPEEEGEADSEYQPNMDMSNMSDDDDSLYSAGTPHSVATSCLSTPDVRGLATPTNTDTPDGFKRPRDLDSSVHSASRTLNFDISPPLQRTYSTRSRKDRKSVV